MYNTLGYKMKMFTVYGRINMKRILALTTLLAAGSSFGQTASTIEVDVSKMSFKDRSSVAYFGAISKSKVDSDGNDVSLDNYILLNYKLTNKLTFNFTPIFSFSEGAKDGFIEADPRVMLMYDTFKSTDGNLSISHRGFLDVPSSKSSQDSDKITKMRLYNITNYKIDDINSLSMWNMFNKTFNTESEESVGETSRHVIYNYISYSNKYLSEKHALRIDYNSDLEHIAGNADTSFKNGEESILFGVDTTLAGVSIYPYAKMLIGAGSVVASDQTGIGMEIYKAF